MSQQTTHPAPESAAAKLFDLRVMIGGLFTVYGVVLIVAGFFASAAELQKAGGININLWLGISMLILGLLFLAWWRLQPVKPPTQTANDVEVSPRATPKPVEDTGADAAKRRSG